MTEFLYWHDHLLLHDFVVLFLLIISFNSLPRQPAPEEVDYDVTDSLEVISSTLLDSEMGVDRGVSGRAGQIFILPIWDVLVSFWITIFLAEAEIDHVEDVRLPTEPDQEVVGLHIPVDEVFVMQI